MVRLTCCLFDRLIENFIFLIQFTFSCMQHHKRFRTNNVCLSKSFAVIRLPLNESYTQRTLWYSDCELVRLLHILHHRMSSICVFPRLRSALPLPLSLAFQIIQSVLDLFRLFVGRHFRLDTRLHSCRSIILIISRRPSSLPSALSASPTRCSQSFILILILIHTLSLSLFHSNYASFVTWSRFFRWSKVGLRMFASGLPLSLSLFLRFSTHFSNAIVFRWIGFDIFVSFIVSLSRVLDPHPTVLSFEAFWTQIV